MSLNVYQKLQKCRAKLKTLPIKESGNNKFAGYTYMELGDFLPHIVDLCEEFQLCPIISFGEAATLAIINSEKPEEQVVFSSPMSSAELKGCHQIQNLGAVETYLRRYLYVSAFDIVEHDALDATTGDKATAPQQQQRPQQQRQQQPQQSAPVDPKDTEYHDRITAALKTLYGDDKKAALDKVESLTTFIPKGKTEAERVKGVRNFLQLKGDRAKYLAHGLERLVKERQQPATCPQCDGILNADGRCPSCEEVG